MTCPTAAGRGEPCYGRAASLWPSADPRAHHFHMTVHWKLPAPKTMQDTCECSANAVDGSIAAAIQQRHTTKIEAVLGLSRAAHQLQPRCPPHHHVHKKARALPAANNKCLARSMPASHRSDRAVRRRRARVLRAIRGRHSDVVCQRLTAPPSTSEFHLPQRAALHLSVHLADSCSHVRAGQRHDAISCACVCT